MSKELKAKAHAAKKAGKPVKGSVWFPIWDKDGPVEAVLYADDGTTAYICPSPWASGINGVKDPRRNTMTRVKSSELFATRAAALDNMLETTQQNIKYHRWKSGRYEATKEAIAWLREQPL